MGSAEANKEKASTVASAIVSQSIALDQPLEVPGGTPFAQVCDAAAAVEMGATKIQMLFADGADVPEDAAGSALESFHMNVITFIAYCQSAMGTQGKTFDAGLRDAAKVLCKSAGKLVTRATESDSAQGALKAVLGECWAAVKDVKKLPKDGRVAISKAFMRVSTFIKDTSTELSELGEGVEDEGGNPTEPDEDDLRFHDEDFTTEEIEVARACASFVSASFEFVRKIIGPIVRGSASDVASLERALDGCRKFQSFIEDVGAGVYPPQDGAALVEDASKAMEEGRTMGKEIAEAGGVEGAEEAVAELEGAFNALREAVNEK